jgi:DNA-binding HxlR family transcriptional regulator
MGKDLSEKADILEVLMGLSDGREKHFAELIELGIPRANLVRRLKELETEGYVERRILPSRPPRTLYKITEKGLELYKRLLKEKVAPLVDEFTKHYPHEVEVILRKYLKFESKK